MAGAIAGPGLRHIFLRDMVLHASIGIHPHEHGAPQRVRINVDLGVAEQAPSQDRLDRVVDYEKVARTVRHIAMTEHINLVETLAERIALACLEDRRVRLARVRVEKLDVFADTLAAGVEIERRADTSSTGR